MTQKYYQPNCFSVPVKFFIFNLRPNFISADICVSRNPSISCTEEVVLYLLNPEVYIVSAINSTQHLRFYFNQRITQGVEIVWNQTADYFTVCLMPSLWLSVLSSASSYWMRER